MSIAFGFAVYFVIWWIALFLVLPFGVRSQHESGEVRPGTEPGAPTRPLLIKKAVWTTAIATVIFIGFYFVYTSGFTFRGWPLSPGSHDGAARLDGVAG